MAFAIRLAALGATAAHAAPVAATKGDFDGSEAVIDFDIFGASDPITNQYAGVGVEFRGLFGMTNAGDVVLFNGSPFICFGGGLQTTTWTATFSCLQSVVGFLAETNAADDVTVEAFNGAASLGTLNFPNPKASGAEPER